MTQSPDDLLAELSSRLWVRLCCELIDTESGQSLTPDTPGRLTAPIAAAMQKNYAVNREHYDAIDMDIDHILAKHAPANPLEMKVPAMQRAAQEIQRYLRSEHDMALLPYEVYGCLREELEAMRTEHGKATNGRAH